MAAMLREMRDIFTRAAEEANIFDSYRPQSLAGEVCAQLTIKLDYALQEVRTLIVTGPTVDDQGNSLSADGSVTSPAAFANLASISPIPAGTYEVTVDFELSGTVAATDNNNIRIVSPGGTPSPILLDNNITTGEQTFGPFVMQTNGGAISLQTSTNAGTAGSVYSGTIIATPVAQNSNGTPFTLQLGSRAWQLLLPPTGIMTQRFNPGILLKASDLNQLISTTPGNWAVEMTGYRSDQ